MPDAVSDSPWVVRVPIALALIGAGLVPIIGVQYSYDAGTRWMSAAGFAMLCIVTGALWMLLGRAPSREPSADARRAVALGMMLGVLWAAEIGINNFVAPPLPARDHIDNGFFLVIAASILGGAMIRAYRDASVMRGIESGAWSGTVSGLVACVAALLLIAGGMRLITTDPLNVAEWAARRAASAAPSMASYFAFETMAGAFLHLIVLGVVLGALLGAIGGLLGRGARRLRTASTSG